MNKTPRLGKAGAQLAALGPIPSLELGDPRLDYGSALATSTSVSSRRGGDGGKANVAITEEEGRPLYRPFRPLP
jgi:hypothetical protein